MIRSSPKTPAFAYLSILVPTGSRGHSRVYLPHVGGRCIEYVGHRKENYEYHAHNTRVRKQWVRDTGPMIEMPRRQPLTSWRKARKKQKKKGLIINNLKNTTPPEEAGGKTKEIAKKKTSESTYAKQRKPRIPIRSVAIVRKCVTRASYMSHTHMQRSPTS